MPAPCCVLCQLLDLQQGWLIKSKDAAWKNLFKTGVKRCRVSVSAPRKENKILASC